MKEINRLGLVSPPIVHCITNIKIKAMLLVPIF